MRKDSPHVESPSSTDDIIVYFMMRVDVLPDFVLVVLVAVSTSVWSLTFLWEE